MNGYALGCEDAGVICPETVNHMGIRIGRIVSADGKLARVKLERKLKNGDGLEIRGKRGQADMIYAGPDTEAGGTAILRLRPETRAEAGDEVARLTDAEQMQTANAMKGRTVPVDLTLRAMAGEPLTLTATDGENRVTLTGETVAEARTRAAEESELIRNLEKTLPCGRRAGTDDARRNHPRDGGGFPAGKDGGNGFCSARDKG